MGLSNAQHEGKDIIAIKGGIGATGGETQTGRTQRRGEARVFNTAGPKVTQTEGWDPKAALKEALGLETGWQSEKTESSVLEKGVSVSWQAVLCIRGGVSRWGRREQGQGGDFMPGSGSPLGNGLAENQKAAKSRATQECPASSL